MNETDLSYGNMIVVPGYVAFLFSFDLSRRMQWTENVEVLRAS